MSRPSTSASFSQLRPIEIHPEVYYSGRGFRNVLQRVRVVVMEHSFTCPYCWQTISMVLDVSVPEQTYVEDCEVCCQPIEVSYTAEDEAVIDFEARALE
jgi:Cysteine-rich CPXCG